MYESNSRQVSELDTHGIIIISTDLVLTPVGNTSVVNFSGRYIERTKGENDTYETKAHFFQFEIWDTAAQYLVGNAKKGDVLMLLSATPREHTWENKETGKKQSRVVFRVNRFKLVKFTPESNPEA